MTAWPRISLTKSVKIRYMYILSSIRSKYICYANHLMHNLVTYPFSGHTNHSDKKKIRFTCIVVHFIFVLSLADDIIFHEAHQSFGLHFFSRFYLYYEKFRIPCSITRTAYAIVTMSTLHDMWYVHRVLD